MRIIDTHKKHVRENLLASRYNPSSGTRIDYSRVVKWMFWWTVAGIIIVASLPPMVGMAGTLILLIGGFVAHVWYGICKITDNR